MPPPTEQGFQHESPGLSGNPVVAMPPPTEQGFQHAPREDRVNTPVVAMPPPTEQGFQQADHEFDARRARRRNALSNRTRISTPDSGHGPHNTPSQCPLQQNKDFNVKRGVDEVYLSRRNAPSNRTRIPTMNTGSKSPSRMSQCPLQQNKDFNLSSDGPCPRYARSQCPLQQNKDFNVGFCEALRQVGGRNASSNRTRISTRRSRAWVTTKSWSQCLLQQNKDFNTRRQSIARSKCRRNAPSNRTRISTTEGTGLSENPSQGLIL